MKISIGSDHGGFELKELIKAHLLKDGNEVLDFGTTNKETSVDYPDYAYKAALALSQGKVDFGIVVCTTGIGVSIVANKIKGVRCALVTNLEQAKLTRLHNNSNVLALGQKNQDNELALKIVDTFLNTDFSGEERHQRRINKITAIEEENHE